MAAPACQCTPFGTPPWTSAARSRRRTTPIPARSPTRSSGDRWRAATDAPAVSDRSPSRCRSGDAAEVLLNRLYDVGYVPGSTEARYVDLWPTRRPADRRDRSRLLLCGCRRRDDPVRSLAARGDDNPAALWIVTRGVHDAVHSSALRQSSSVGTCGRHRVEHPELWGGLLDTEFGADIGVSHSALSSVLARAEHIDHGAARRRVPCPGIGAGRPVSRFGVPCSAPRCGIPHHRRHGHTRSADGGLAGRPGRSSPHPRRPYPLPPRRDWDTRGREPRRARKDHRDKEPRDARSLGRHVASTSDPARRVRTLIARRDRDGAPPIRGIIHAAGVTNNDLLTMAARVPMRAGHVAEDRGAQVLHEVFPPGSLDFFFLTGLGGNDFRYPGAGRLRSGQRLPRRAGAVAPPSRLPHRQSRLGGLARTRVRRGRTHRSSRARATGSRPITPEEAFTAWEHVNSYTSHRRSMVPSGRLRRRESSTESAKPARAWSHISGRGSPP